MVSKAKKNEKLSTVSGQPVDIAVVADHAATEALAPRKLIEETDWFEVKGFSVKAVKVAPSIYQAARSHLRALMRSNAPEPPEVKGPDGKLKPNKHHPQYIKDMAVWESLYQDIDDDLFFSIAVLAGLHIHPNDAELIPPTETWMPGVIFQLKLIGVDLQNSSEYLMYSGDPGTLNLLLFKKFILLDDPELFKAFMAFQQRSTGGVEIPVELMSRFGADMFRNQESG